MAVIVNVYIICRHPTVTVKTIGIVSPEFRTAVAPLRDVMRISRNHHSCQTRHADTLPFPGGLSMEN
jgi:hypothetical protein